MNIGIFLSIVFLCLNYIILGDGFVFDTNTAKTQLQGQSIVDNDYSTLLKLLLDERKDRVKLEKRLDALEKQTGCKDQTIKLEQRVQEIEKQTGCKEQTIKLEQRIQQLEKQTGCNEKTIKFEQLSTFVLELENRIKQIEVRNEHKVSFNETIYNITRARINNVSDLIENKYQTLHHKDDELLHKQQATQQTVAGLRRNISDRVVLKEIDQVHLLETLSKRVDSVERKSKIIMDTAQTREKDFTFINSYLENKISKMGNNLKMTLNLQLRNLSNKRKSNNNISTRNGSTRLAKEETSIQNMVKKLFTESRKQQQIVNASLLQLNSRLDIVHQDLNVTTQLLKSRTKKVGLTACVIASSIYNAGTIIPFHQIRSIIGINQTTQFLPNGTFICEDTGLYIITITMATQHGGWMSIFKNDESIMDFFDTSSTGVDTATQVMTAIVKKNDRVYVKTYSNTFLYEPYSCLTIVKIV